MADLTLSDRIALAVCRSTGNPDGSCVAICRDCRRDSAAVAHEIAGWLRERHGGGSTTADLLDGVGCHPHGGSQPVQQPSQIRDGTTPRQRLAMARYKRQLNLCIIRRAWRLTSCWLGYMNVISAIRAPKS